jgi:chemotaxis protein methyltransferase CheR
MAMSQQSFDAVTSAFEKVSGIRLGEAKKALVEGRLQKLAQDKGEFDIDRYVSNLLRGDDRNEFTRLVDKLTTNETYFFREPQHFEFLTNWLKKSPPSGTFRVWSGASSSGEEAYSIAMLLSDMLGPSGWDIVGTDLSTAMVAAARQGLYPMERTRMVPPAMLKKYCLRGRGAHEGQVLMDKKLRAKVRFEGGNLMQTLPEIGQFDLIFLRNVLIYFDAPAKQHIVRNVIKKLKPGGYLFTGHAESLSNLDTGLRSIQPAVYEIA